MTSMDRSSPNTDPQQKICKTKSTYKDSRTMVHSYPSSPTPNIVQRIKYVLAMEHSEKVTPKRLLYQEIDYNLTVFDMDGIEFLAVNASLNEIVNWTPQHIPYQCFWVRNNSERKNAMIRIGTMLPSHHQLTPCAIGIKIDPQKCASTDLKYHKMAELRRSLWHFILSEISILPPHIQTFLEPELNTEAQTLKQKELPKIKPVKKHKHTGISDNEVKIFLTCSINYKFSFNISLFMYFTQSINLDLNH